MGQEVTKAEFADIIGVNRSRISQMITEGKISGDALVGEGRKAKIDVDLAKAQIRARTDLGQSLGNGLATQVHDVPEKIAIAAPTPARPSFDDDLRRARLESLLRDNRKAAVEEAARQGQYVLASEVRAGMTKLATEMLNAFEGAVKGLSDGIATQFSLPQRDVEHAVREGIRVMRERAAEVARKKAIELPELVADVLDGD